MLFVCVAFAKTNKDFNYNVKVNDTLMTISFIHYGTHHCWDIIQKVNPSIVDPNKIEKNIVLKIPGRFECRHPNTRHMKQVTKHSNKKIKRVANSKKGYLSKENVTGLIVYDENGDKHKKLPRNVQKRPRNYKKKGVYSDPKIKRKRDKARLKIVRKLEAKRSRKLAIKRREERILREKREARLAKEREIERQNEIIIHKKREMEAAIAKVKEEARQEVLAKEKERERKKQLAHLREIEESKKSILKKNVEIIKKSKLIEEHRKIQKEKEIAHQEGILRRKNEIFKLKEKERKIQEKKNRIRTKKRIAKLAKKNKKKLQELEKEYLVPGGPKISSIKRHNKYTIQIAAYKTLKEAQVMGAKIDYLKIKKRIEKFKSKDKAVWFRIRVGHFKSLNEAKHYLSKSDISLLVKDHFIVKVHD